MKDFFALKICRKKLKKIDKILYNDINYIYVLNELKIKKKNIG